MGSTTQIFIYSRLWEAQFRWIVFFVGKLGFICQNGFEKKTFANEDIATVACASLHLAAACQKQQLLFEAVICKIASIVCFLSLHKYDDWTLRGKPAKQTWIRLVKHLFFNDLNSRLK